MGASQLFEFNSPVQTGGGGAGAKTIKPLPGYETSYVELLIGLAHLQLEFSLSLSSPFHPKAFYLY